MGGAEGSWQGRVTKILAKISTHSKRQLSRPKLSPAKSLQPPGSSFGQNSPWSKMPAPETKMSKEEKNISPLGHQNFGQNVNSLKTPAFEAQTKPCQEPSAPR